MRKVNRQRQPKRRSRALVAALVGANLAAPAWVLLPLTLLVGALGGAAWALLPALLKIWRGVNEIVSSLFLNYVAIYFTNWLLAGTLEAPKIGVAQTEIIPPEGRFPIIVEGSKITWALVLAAAVVVAVHFLFRTPFGFDLRIIGGSRKVADYLGIRVGRATIVAFAISGAIGGLAGVTEVLGNQFFLSQDFSPGWGYTGIAVAVLGGLAAFGITFAALFFGLIGAAALQMQFTLGLSPFFALVVQATALIVVLLGIEWRNRAQERAASRPADTPDSAPPQVATEAKA